MANITSLSQFAVRGGSWNVIGGTGTPKRMQDYFIKHVSVTAADTLNLKTIVDSDISAIEAITLPLSAGNVVVGGTAITISGPTATFTATGSIGFIATCSLT